MKNCVGRNLSALIYDKRTTQSALAQIAGASDGAMSLWVSGKAHPRMKYLEKISDHFGIPVDELTSQNGYYVKLYELENAPEGAVAPIAPRKAYAKLYGRVHAGKSSEPELLDERVPVPYEVLERHPHGYFLLVEGDCMDKVYPGGCYVFIDPSLDPKNNSIAVVSIDGQDYIMRRLKLGADTIMLSPESHNPEWGDIIITDQETTVEMVGTVVWFQASKELE